MKPIPVNSFGPVARPVAEKVDWCIGDGNGIVTQQEAEDGLASPLIRSQFTPTELGRFEHEMKHGGASTGSVGTAGVPQQDTRTARTSGTAAQYQAVGATGMGDPYTQHTDVGLAEATKALANASVSNGWLSGVRSATTSAQPISAAQANALLAGSLRDLGVLETQVVSDPKVGSYLLSWVPDSRTMGKVENFLRQTEQKLDFPYDVQVYHAPGAPRTGLPQLNAADAVAQMAEPLRRYGATTITVERSSAGGQYMLVRALDQKTLDSLVAMLEILEKKVEFPWDAALDPRAKPEAASSLLGAIKAGFGHLAGMHAKAS